MTSDAGELRRRARALAAEAIAPTAAARDREARWDGAALRRLACVGLLAPTATASELAALGDGLGEGGVDPGLAHAWGAHTAGASVVVARLAGDELRARWLPALASGEALGAVAHAERLDAPSATGIATRVRASARGRWVLDGQKHLVVNAPVADVLVVTAEDDGGRVQAFLVERRARGVTVGPRLVTDGLRTATFADVRLDGCVVWEEERIGLAGEGLSRVMRLVRRYRRAVALAPWVGLSRALVEASVAHARVGRRVGRPLASSQAVRARLVDMRTRVDLAARLVAHAAREVDRGDACDDRALASAALFVSETLSLVARAALEVHGLDCLGSDRPAVRLARDATLGARLLDEHPDVLAAVIGGALLGLG